MKVRILLVASDMEDVLFLRDVLEEMESSEFWSGWLHLSVFDAPTWSTARSILATEPIDVMLLDLNVADAGGAECFRQAQASLPQVPIVLLVDEYGVDAAERLLREGAQDFLIKKQIDCEPLAHALRNAIERHRLLAAARAAAMADPLTGLLNLAAFQKLAGRDARLAEGIGRRMAVIVVEQPECAYSNNTQEKDLALMEAADQLRSIAAPTDLVARIGEARFGIAVFETDAESVEHASARYQSKPLSKAARSAVAVFNPYHPSSLDTLLERAESELASATATARA